MHYVASVFYFWKKDLDRSATEVDAALTLNPNYAQALNSRGIVNIYGGEPLAAVPYIDDVRRPGVAEADLLAEIPGSPNERCGRPVRRSPPARRFLKSGQRPCDHVIGGGEADAKIRLNGGLLGRARHQPFPVPRIVTDQTYHETSPLNCTALVHNPFSSQAGRSPHVRGAAHGKTCWT